MPESLDSKLRQDEAELLRAGGRIATGFAAMLSLPSIGYAITERFADIKADSPAIAATILIGSGMFMLSTRRQRLADAIADPIDPDHYVQM